MNENEPFKVLVIVCYHGGGTGAMCNTKVIGFPTAAQARSAIAAINDKYSERAPEELRPTCEATALFTY